MSECDAQAPHPTAHRLEGRNAANLSHPSQKAQRGTEKEINLVLLQGLT